jgi:hypothetical protein
MKKALRWVRLFFIGYAAIACFHAIADVHDRLSVLFYTSMIVVPAILAILISFLMNKKSPEIQNTNTLSR